MLRLHIAGSIGSKLRAAKNGMSAKLQTFYGKIAPGSHIKDLTDEKLPALTDFLNSNVFKDIKYKLLYQPKDNVDSIRNTGAKLADDEDELAKELALLMSEEEKNPFSMFDLWNSCIPPSTPIQCSPDQYLATG